jgi:hypothetical protein
MVEDQTIIRHCTESKDRLKDKLYYQGSILGSPAPTDGLRPDHVKNGWPGPITQTIEDGFFVGTNSGRNPDRDYYTLNPEAAHIPPPQPGQDDKDATEFFRRLRFFDPERCRRSTWWSKVPALQRRSVAQCLSPLRIQRRPHCRCGPGR